jgi:hypothetical protein
MNSGENRVALELHNVDLEHGPKPRGDNAAPPTVPATAEADPDDVPF